MAQKTVAITFFTYSAALNFFAEENDGCLDVMVFLFCFAYRVINPCCISYNNTLQEFRSLIGVACQMHDRVQFDELCDRLWNSSARSEHSFSVYSRLWTMLCALGREMSGSQGTLISLILRLSFPTTASAQLKLLSVEDILSVGVAAWQHLSCHCRRCITTLTLLFRWHYKCAVQLHQLGLNLHRCDHPSHSKIKSRGVPRHLTILPAGQPTINWMYGDTTCLRRSLVPVRQICSTRTHYVVKSEVDNVTSSETCHYLMF